MDDENKERIRTIVLALSPAIKNGLFTLVIEREDSSRERVIISTDRQKRDAGKTYIATLYQQAHKKRMSYKVCADVLRGIREELQRAQPASPASNLTSETHTQPAIHSQPVEATDSFLDTLEETDTPNVWLHRASNKVYQLDRRSHEYKPVASWSIPHVYARYQRVDSHMISSYVFDVEIDGKREMLERGDIDSGKYRKQFNLGNVSSRWLDTTYQNILVSEARKAPLLIKERTTGLYERQEYPYAGFMYPDSHMFLSDGSIYPSAMLTRELPAKEREAWCEYEEGITTYTDTQIEDAYNFVKHVASHGLGLLLLSNNARCLSHSLSTDRFHSGHMVYLYGEQGSGKTNLALLARGIAQPYRGESLTPIDATFRSTIASVENAIDCYKDVPIVIDDLLQSPTESESMLRDKEKIVERMARSAFDGNPIRERMDTGMNKQTSRYVRTLPVLTGEKYLKYVPLSGHRRILSVEVTKNDVTRKETDMSYGYSLDNSKMYSYALFALGNRIIRNILTSIENDRGELLHTLEEKFSEYQQRLYTSITAMWNEHQHIDFPHEADSLLDICTNILIGAYHIDSVTDERVNCVEDVYPCIVQTLYKQLCRMSNVAIDDSDRTPLQDALERLYMSMGIEVPVRVGNESMYLYAKDYQTDAVPTGITYMSHNDDKTMSLADVIAVDARQWGKDRFSNISSRVALYVHAGEGNIYLLSTGVSAIAQFLSDDEGIPYTPATVKNMLIDEGIALNDRDGRHIGKQFKRDGVKDRAMRISLDRFMSIVESNLQSDEVEKPENVTSIDSKRSVKTDSTSLESILNS